MLDGDATDDDTGPIIADDDTAPVDQPSAVTAVTADDTAGLPWTPVFDQRDDLGGVLDARSPLLSRAFGARPQLPAD